MRAALLYNPRILCERLNQAFAQRRRLRRLRGTCAGWLSHGHIDSLELIEMTAAEGARVYYDIGANVGTWTLLCRAIVPQSAIVAFEPMEKHIIAFKDNTRELENIRLMPSALGHLEETRVFHPVSFSDASSFLPLSDTGREIWRLENETPQTMTVSRLDQMIAAEKLPAPDVLKLDVQGFELEVLKGGEGATRNARWVLCEVSFKTFYEGQVMFSEVVGYLADRGFEAYAFGYSVRAAVPLEQVDVLFRRR